MLSLKTMLLSKNRFGELLLKQVESLDYRHGILLVASAIFAALACPATAQYGGVSQFGNPPQFGSQKYPKVNYPLNANAAPGVVANAQVLRQTPGVGTFQPVAISGPDKLNVGLAREGQFLPGLDAPVTTGMLVGAVYRFKVTNIPFREGQELYPTVEIIDRVCPPNGREHRFPIPVVLTDEDLRLALDGALVTRVIYVEDNGIAEPVAAEPGTQRTLNVGAIDNALQAADQLGRPVAILRIGSRVPADLTGDLTTFLYGCPPWVPLNPVPTRENLTERGMWPEMAPVVPAEEIFSQPPAEATPRVP